MQIRELERTTGLDRATIRFYEKEGLITPIRQDNGYREYSDSDRDMLLKIMLLRQLGLSLERIKELQQGSADFSKALAEQIKELERQAQKTNRAKDVCREMLDNGVDFATLDAQRYLKLMNQPAADTAKARPTAKVFSEPVMRECHPWRRYFARYLDALLFNVLVQFLIVVILRIRPYDFLDKVLDYVAIFLLVPANALWLCKTGTTPGKWIMGLRVENGNGGRLSYSDALSREWGVLRYGLGFGLPIYEIYRLYKSYVRYVDDGEMDWDIDNEYQYSGFSIRNIAGMAAAIAAVAGMLAWNVFDGIRPRYRGEDLTIAEFAENYNYNLSIILEDADITAQLQSDGTWYPKSDNSVTVYLMAQPEIEDAEFAYETEDGNIRRISYQNSWTGIWTYINTIPYNCQIAAYTAIGSQENISFQEIREYEKLMEQEISKANGHIVMENVEINWSIECEDCSITSDGRFMVSDVDENASASLQFEIIIKDSTD